MEIPFDYGLLIAFGTYIIARLETNRKFMEKIKDALLEVHPELGEVFK